MWRLFGKKCFLIGSLAFVLTPIALALSPDHRLISLVPPGAQVVDGMIAPSGPDQRGNFLVITHNNKVDFQDFFALTGADPARRVHEVILTASPDISGTLRAHSLLASGHFDQVRIYRSAADGGANVIRYRGIYVLLIEPFVRERAEFNDVRWLAILDSEVLLFGTVDVVLQEIDRHLAGNPADPSLLKRLGHLRDDDETWCLVAAPGGNDEISNALEALDPTLARLIEEGGAFQFGIHYGGHIAFEYEVTGVDAEPISESLTRSLAGQDAKASSLLSRAVPGGGSSAVHGTVKLSRRCYDAFLAAIYSHTKP